MSKRILAAAVVAPFFLASQPVQAATVMYDLTYNFVATAWGIHHIDTDHDLVPDEHRYYDYGTVSGAIHIIADADGAVDWWSCSIPGVPPCSAWGWWDGKVNLASGDVWLDSGSYDGSSYVNLSGGTGSIKAFSDWPHYPHWIEIYASIDSYTVDGLPPVPLTSSFPFLASGLIGFAALARRKGRRRES